MAQPREKPVASAAAGEGAVVTTAATTMVTKAGASPEKPGRGVTAGKKSPRDGGTTRAPAPPGKTDPPLKTDPGDPPLKTDVYDE